jgi:hypothetical protein
MDADHLVSCRRGNLYPWCLAVVAVGWAVSGLGADAPLGPRCRVAFANVAQAREILTNRDEFIRALSPFDRAARMKSDTPQSEEAFLRFLAASALAWEPAESNRIGVVLSSLKGKLARWDLPLPSTLVLVKTTGEEEGNAVYTRQNAIIFSQREARSASSDLLAHELFHVLSRHSAPLREQLYRVIGFQPINEVKLPPALAAIKITNPDGVHHNFMIRVRHEDAPLAVVPVLYASSPRYDVKRGGAFFDYLVFKLLALQETGGTYEPRWLNGSLQLLDPGAMTGFYEQVGRNTEYLLHPDEILADNFVFLVNGQTNLPTPRIVREMDRVLTAFPGSASSPAR